MTAGGLARRRPAAPPAAPPVDVRALQGQRAGLVTRCAANVVDFLVTLALLTGGYLAVAAVRFLWNPRSFSFPAAPLGFAVLAGGALAGGYFAVAWMTTGRTYGDFLLGLRVVNRAGERLHPGLALLRAVACVIVPIGLLWAGLNRGRLSLQDAVLRTLVVYDWSEPGPEPPTLR